MDLRHHGPAAPVRAHGRLPGRLVRPRHRQWGADRGGGPGAAPELFPADRQPGQRDGLPGDRGRLRKAQPRKRGPAVYDGSGSLPHGTGDFAPVHPAVQPGNAGVRLGRGHALYRGGTHLPAALQRRCAGARPDERLPCEPGKGGDIRATGMRRDGVRPLQLWNAQRFPEHVKDSGAGGPGRL